jgi:single-stranded DNA-binding protein
MRGINKVVFSGNIGERIRFHETGKGVPSCSFQVASDRHAHGEIVTAWVKVNAYGQGLVRSCKPRLKKGAYVIVEGELMNRDKRGFKELVEIRAREVIFPFSGRREETHAD